MEEAHSHGDAGKKLEWNCLSYLSPKTEKSAQKVVSGLAKVALPNGTKARAFIRTDFDYVPGVVIMQFLNSANGDITYGHDEQHELHRIRQMAKFNLAFVLHPYNDNQKFPYHLRHRMMANVIGEIGEYALKRGLPLCFPHSTPRRGGEEDLSQIIYFKA